MIYDSLIMANNLLIKREKNYYRIVKEVKQINKTPKPSLHKDPELNEKTVAPPRTKNS